MGLALGIRTHFYDDCIKYSYDQWQQILGDDVFLLVDETRGEVDVAGARKVSWTEADAGALGLPLTPAHKVPWYNGDYHIYHMIPHLQPNDFCVLVEHDVFVKLSDKGRLRELLQGCAGFDFVATRIGSRPPHWKWRRDLGDLYQVVHGALVMIVGFNRRAAEYLLERRLALHHKRDRLGLAGWPNVEAFVGTELHHADSLKIGDLEDFAGLTRDRIRTMPPFLFDDLMANATPDVLYHPCLPRERFLHKCRPLFRFQKPMASTWDALWPFVSTATKAEMKQLDWLARRYWNTRSYLAAFPSRQPGPAGVSGSPQHQGEPSRQPRIATP